MLLRQIEYFCAVARTGSFTRAAEACYVSQSAISQQVKALEVELGCTLIERRGRGLALTAAGEHLARRGQALLDDAETLRYEVEDIAYGRPSTLRIGYLNRYDGSEVAEAVAAFALRHPQVDVTAEASSHDGLYHKVLAGELDLVFNDRRRALSSDFVNYHLLTSWGYIMCSEACKLAGLAQVTAPQLQGLTCILVCPPEQEEVERAYYGDQLSFPCDFTRADTLEQARFMVAGNKGFLPISSRNETEDPGTVIRRIPLMTPAADGAGELVHSHSDYYAFWLRARENAFAPEFAEILKDLFS